jgi:SnoaL-like domain
MDESYLSKVTELINKSEVTAVVNSYFRTLDEKNFDAGRFATIFTAEATVTRPNGASLTGPEQISASHQRSFTRFEGSQHLLAVPDIAIDGGTATVRANWSPCMCGKAVTPMRTKPTISLLPVASSRPS